jgi:sRNA-binding protein
MGKEACKEDEAEAAVDLDGDEAGKLDSASESRETAQTSLAQMEANVVPGEHKMQFRVTYHARNTPRYCFLACRKSDRNGWSGVNKP